MALYQVNDVVTVIDEMDEGTIYRTRITEILADAQQGAPEEIYGGEIIDERHNGLEIEFTLDEVDDLIGGPTFDAENPPTPIVVGTAGELDTGAIERAIREQPLRFVPNPGFDGQVIQEQAQPRERREPAVGIWEQLERTYARPIFATAIDPINTAEPAPQPEQPEPEIREAIGAMGITVADYRPELNSGRVLRSFRLTNGVLLTPQRLGAEYVFADEEGTIWVNKFQNPDVASWGSHRDTVNIYWMTLTNYQTRRTGRTPSGVFTTKSKKKLRRKYDKMPVIKEERFYASKEFIA